MSVRAPAAVSNLNTASFECVFAIVSILLPDKKRGRVNACPL
jgi:hypothetical protein